MPMSAEYQAELDERRERPFRFEDLPLTNGKRIEPEEWGPRYSKPVKAGKVRHVEPPSNCASGQPFEFSAKKHRAKMKAVFTAMCNADKRAWANDDSKAKHDAYAAAPKYKPRKPHYIFRAGEWKLAA